MTASGRSAAEDGSGVRVDREQAVQRVTLVRPPVNALGAAQYAALADAFGPEDGVRVRVLRAEGRVFCAGQDLAEAAALGSRHAGAYLAAAAASVATVARARVPLADVVVMSEDAWLSFPEARHGLPLGLSVLSAVFPARLARSLLATGRRLPAARLAALGAVDAVVPRARLEERAADEVQRLLGLPAPASAWLYGGTERAARATAYLAEAAAAVDAGTWPDRGERTAEQTY